MKKARKEELREVVVEYAFVSPSLFLLPFSCPVISHCNNLEETKQNRIMECACGETKTNPSRLRYSHRLASPKEYRNVTEDEKNKKPPTCYTLI